jgi:hypothetical protein
MLLNILLKILLQNSPKIKKVSLVAMPYMSSKKSKSKSHKRETQSKLNKYYTDIGFQKMTLQNNFEANIEDVINGTQNYGRGIRTQKQLIKRRLRGTRIQKQLIKRRTRRIKK